MTTHYLDAPLGSDLIITLPEDTPDVEYERLRTRAREYFAGRYRVMLVRSERVTFTAIRPSPPPADPVFGLSDEGASWAREEEVFHA